MGKHKVALIGTGGRSASYASAYASSEDTEIVALADPNADHRRSVAENCRIPPGFAEYDDWKDMLREQGDLDGAVIATPNYLHAEPAVACYERGLPIALEKPLEVTKERCERILDAQGSNSGRTLIGFVLRSTPFYAMLQRLVHEGAVGRICSLQADELPGWTVTSIMNRSPWRRFHAKSGGSMLEKSCHDMDLLSWIMGCRPVSLTSYGSTLMFNPNPSLPETCDDCKVAAECSYYRAPALASQEDSGEAQLHRFIREDNRCIYNIDKDVIDVQNISLLYENGAVANFMLNFHTAGTRAGRNIHVVGSKGRLWGSLHDQVVYHHDNSTDTEEEHSTATDGTGHGGGDRKHALELVRMMDEADYRPQQNAEAAYLSAVMCFASDISRVERRRVELRYRENGRIDIV